MNTIGAGDSLCGRPDVLLISEVEAYVETLEPSTFNELGSLRWLDKHSRLEKLTAQAITEAISQKEEFVKETFITHEKLTILIHDLILIELWREEILPKLLNTTKSSSSEAKESSTSFSLYTVLFHEAICINLIETILYHSESVQLLEDDVLDLIDYCQRSIQQLVINTEIANQEGKDEVTATNVAAAAEKGELQGEFERQIGRLQMRIGFKTIAILRYLIDNIDRMNTSIVPRLTITFDAPMLLVEILLKKPWIRTNSKGIEQQYSEEYGDWIEINCKERLLASKIEIQAWIALYQLFLCPRVISTYEIHYHRRGQLLELRSLLNQVLLDQLPILNEFQRWLHELSMGSHFPPTKSPLILEMFPRYRTILENQLNKDRTTIIEIHKKELLNCNKDDLIEKAKKLADIYVSNAFESALPANKCANCGEPAIKRCSRCHFVYYCKRECQVGHWLDHKKVCDKVKSQFDKLKEEYCESSETSALKFPG